MLVTISEVMIHFSRWPTNTTYQARCFGFFLYLLTILSSCSCGARLCTLMNIIVNINELNTSYLFIKFCRKCSKLFYIYIDGCGGWSSDGCHVTSSNSTEVICECNHLTSFAILLVRDIIKSIYYQRLLKFFRMCLQRFNQLRHQD